MRYIIVGTVSGNLGNTYSLILGSSLNGVQETKITEGKYKRGKVCVCVLVLQCRFINRLSG